MPLTSASPATSRVAAVYDFLSALARRHLAQRIGCRASLHVYETAAGVFTLATQSRSCATESVENRFAQLRAAGTDAYQLFWKNGSGRWTPYCQSATQVALGADREAALVPGERVQSFLGSIDECLCEIARDPRGCFWS